MRNLDLGSYPAGFKPGCVARKSRPGEWCPMAADRVPLVPEGEWDRLAERVNLRPWVPSVFDQNGHGSCAAESSAGAIKTVRAVAGLPFVELNPLSLYHFSGGGADRGSSIDENLRLLMEIGCAPLSVWPRSKGYRQRPSDEAMEAALQFRIAEFWDVTTVPEFVSCLLRGFPVVFGANGHALCAVHHEGSFPLVLNSWGEPWGDGGFGKWVSYARINWSYGAFAVRCSTAPDAQEIT